MLDPRRVFLFLVLLVVTALPMSAMAQTPPVGGVVNDASGGAVAGATVIARSPSGAEQRAVTEPDGRFTVRVTTPGAVTIIVRASGFKELRRALAATDPRSDLRLSLEPADVIEAVTVTSTRSEQQLGAVAASVNIVDRAEIRRSPAVVADDLLRQIPSFSLFRRTSSLSSHPTAQGVSLRGIGPSGVSRTLVLLDGVPFNDPFGGWVYWTRVPLESADRIEAIDGTTSSLYGNFAMGGVINIVTTPPTPRTLELRTQYGSRNSPKIDVRASDVWGRFGVSADFGGFDTEGYPIVAQSERGVVDTKAQVTFRNLNLRMQYDLSSRVQAFSRVSYFREKRENAKVSTFDATPEKNDTEWTSVSGGVRMRIDDASEITANVFTDHETFNSNFLAVPAATPLRSIGRMTLNQTVPTTGVGFGTVWQRAFGPRHAVSAGFDWRQARGESQEQGLDATRGTTVTLNRFSGGRQRMTGLFVQDLFSLTPELTVTLAARLDRWQNDEGHNLETNIPAGTPTAGNVASLPSRSDAVGSPRVAATYQVNSRMSVWGSLGSGFRAPTLNELYRQFRVGTVLTLANADLGPERLVGGELGVRVAPVRQMSARLTWYDNRVTDPVSNVTTATSGANVTQQRQNLGGTKIRGLQADVEYHVTPSLRLEAGYLFNRAVVTKFDANPALVDKFLPQVPRHRGSVSVSWSDPRWVNVSVDVQAVGRQFDDDLNSRIVPGYTTPGLPAFGLVSFQVSRTIRRDLDVFVGAQNLFDREYFVGTLPTTIGTPRLVSGGIRIRVRGR